MTRTARAGQDPARHPRRGQQSPAIPAPPPADEDGLDAYVKEIVDALPPLTDEQRDLLAVIFRQRHK